MNGSMPDETHFDRVVAIGWVPAGPPPHRGLLLDVAAVAMDGETVTARFSGRIEAGPATPLAPAQTNDQDLTAPGPPRPAGAVLGDMVAAMPAAWPWVVHNAEAFRAYARRSCRDWPPPPLLDTLRLSGVCYPGLPSHTLDFLQQTLGLPAAGTIRALDRAEATGRLWLRLRADVLALPQPVRQAIGRLLRGFRREPLRELFQWALEHGGGEPGALVEQVAETSTPRRRPAPEGQPVQPLDADAVTSLLDPEGPLAQELGHYEYREEQIRMAHAVVQSFNGSRHLLAEAGTGVGKSLAYLLPAMLWAVVNESPVVVSTNTRNLQAQLVAKDLPLLCRTLQGEVRFAMIKGRRNYLCLRKLLYLLAHGETELERDDRLPLASVLVWLVRTTSGDIGESMVGERPHLRELASRLTSVAEECRGMDCEQRRRCFLQRARRLAMAADVVVANHAVVFSEMANPMLSPVLPPHHQIVFDEAHNLEDAITSAMSREVSLRRARSVLGRLLRPGPRRRLRGLIPSLQQQLRKARSVPQEARQQALVQADAVLEAIRAADGALEPFFVALSGVLRRQGRPQQTFRLYPDRDRPAEWAGIEAHRQRLLERIAGAVRGTTALADALAALGEDYAARVADFDRELRAAALWLGEFCRDLADVLDAREPGWVCWVEPAPPALGGAQAWGAPIEVGPLMHEHLYSIKKSVVFTSATMTVNGSVDYFRRRLGIGLIEPERLDVLVLGTVFDYARQSLVLVPTFLPEPDDPKRDYGAELCVLLGRLFRQTGGRALALFTSHEMLQRCAGPLRQELAGDGIRVFAQGLSGSRESLLQRLASDPRTVLLGAHSFWEGVDVVGANLSCVVLARLPFAVHTDPVIAARCAAIEEEGGNAFLDYSLPAAVIRFRQGFGRLIRHRQDRGVIVVADRRIVSKRYGECFRASVPAPVRPCPDEPGLIAAVADFLDR